MSRFEVKYRKKWHDLEKQKKKPPLTLKRDEWTRVYCTSRTMAEMFAQKIIRTNEYEIEIIEF